MGAMNLQVMAVTLIVLALVLYLVAARSRKQTGIPAGELFYQDLAGQPFQGEPLRSHDLGISGKPDCLIRTADGTVPVELKNSSRPPARGGVYPNHMIQALAYCALVEDQMNVRAPYALVIYAGQQVRRVEFTNERRQWLLQTIHEVELARERLAANRNHDHRARCAGCGVRAHCNQALL
jgi:CRISPR-associated exonuclease Cas4